MEPNDPFGDFLWALWFLIVVLCVLILINLANGRAI